MAAVSGCLTGSSAEQVPEGTLDPTLPQAGPSQKADTTSQLLTPDPLLPPCLSFPCPHIQAASCRPVTHSQNGPGAGGASELVVCALVLRSAAGALSCGPGGGRVAGRVLVGPPLHAAMTSSVLSSGLPAAAWQKSSSSASSEASETCQSVSECSSPTSVSAPTCYRAQGGPGPPSGGARSPSPHTHVFPSGDLLACPCPWRGGGRTAPAILGP